MATYPLAIISSGQTPPTSTRLRLTPSTSIRTSHHNDHPSSRSAVQNTAPWAPAAHEVRQRCLTAVGPRKRDQAGSSDLHIVKVGNARFHHVQVHFDEVILDAAGFRRGKDFLPVQSVLSHRHHFLGFR